MLPIRLPGAVVAVANNTMVMTLNPQLLDRWMGSSYVHSAAHEWDTENNTVPSIITQLRECCGDNYHAGGNMWRAGRCVLGSSSSSPTARSVNAGDSGNDNRNSRSSVAHRDTGGAAAGFRTADGEINQLRMQQWLLNGLNFLSKSCLLYTSPSPRDRG